MDIIILGLNALLSEKTFAGGGVASKYLIDITLESINRNPTLNN